LDIYTLKTGKQKLISKAQQGELAYYLLKNKETDTKVNMCPYKHLSKLTINLRNSPLLKYGIPLGTSFDFEYGISVCME